MSDFVHLHLHTTYSLLDGQCQIGPLVAKAKALGDSMVNNQDDNGRIRTYWIPEPGDDDPLAGAIRLPLGGDRFNCMASDVEALAELVSATASNDQAGNRNK